MGSIVEVFKGGIDPEYFPVEKLGVAVEAERPAGRLGKVVEVTVGGAKARLFPRQARMLASDLWAAAAFIERAEEE